jgi:flagellar assembly protein FliH
MATDDTPLTKSAPGEEEALPVATLLRADEVKTPEIKPWQYQDLAKEEAEKARKLRSDVEEKLREEIRPEILRRASVLKKEAYETAQKEGYDAGYQEGLEKGRKEAFDKAEKEADAALSVQVKSLQKLVEAMSDPYQQIAQNVFESLAKLSVDLAEKLVASEIQSRHDWILTVVQEAIGKLPDDSVQLEVILNPDNADIVQKYQQAHQKKWRLQTDDSLEVGTCKIKQGSSLIINDWRTRLDELLENALATAEKVAKEPSQPLASASGSEHTSS